MIIAIFGALFHGAEALMGPFAQHSGFDWKNLGVLLAWGAVGALIAIRRFRWDPRSE